MKYKHLKLRAAFFKDLYGLSKKDAKEYMKECSDEHIHVICEALYNICNHSKLKYDENICRERECLNKYIKNLAKKSVDVKYKREILQKIGYEVLSLIHFAVLPLLKELL